MVSLIVMERSLADDLFMPWNKEGSAIIDVACSALTIDRVPPISFLSHQDLDWANACQMFSMHLKCLDLAFEYRHLPLDGQQGGSPDVCATLATSRVIV